MSDQSNIQEAVRLRGEGLSLRAIGKQMGVDQKQVQRWLKATGKETSVPKRITGLDGRKYRVGKVTPNKKYPVAHVTELQVHLYRGLGKLLYAVRKEHQAVIKAVKQGLDNAETEAERRAAWVQSLVKRKLHTGDFGLDKDGNAADAEVGFLINLLLDRVTRECLEFLRDEIDDALEKELSAPKPNCALTADSLELSAPGRPVPMTADTPPDALLATLLRLSADAGRTKWDLEEELRRLTEEEEVLTDKEQQTREQLLPLGQLLTAIAKDHWPRKDVRTLQQFHKEAREQYEQQLKPTIDKLKGLLNCDRSTFAPSIIAGHAQVLEREIKALLELLTGEDDGVRTLAGHRDDCGHAGLATFLNTVAPLLDQLDEWGQAHEYQMSPKEIAKIAVRLRRLIEDRLGGPVEPTREAIRRREAKKAEQE